MARVSQLSHCASCTQSTWLVTGLRLGRGTVPWHRHPVTHRSRRFMSRHITPAEPFAGSASPFGTLASSFSLGEMVKRQLQDALSA
eukprot:1488293-Amphidinium_carterae.1